MNVNRSQKNTQILKVFSVCSVQDTKMAVARNL